MSAAQDGSHCSKTRRLLRCQQTHALPQVPWLSTDTISTALRQRSLPRVGRTRHKQYPLRETPSTLHMRLTGNLSGHSSMNSNLACLVARRGPPRFLECPTPPVRSAEKASSAGSSPSPSTGSPNHQKCFLHPLGASASSDIGCWIIRLVHAPLQLGSRPSDEATIPLRSSALVPMPSFSSSLSLSRVGCHHPPYYVHFSRGRSESLLLGVNSM